MKVKLTLHAKQRMSRLFGLDEQSVINDIKRECWAMRKEMGGYLYMVHGKIAKYPVVIENKGIKVITILFKRNSKGQKYNKSYQYEPFWCQLTKKEIKKLFTNTPTIS